MKQKAFFDNEQHLINIFSAHCLILPSLAPNHDPNSPVHPTPLPPSSASHHAPSIISTLRMPSRSTIITFHDHFYANNIKSVSQRLVALISASILQLLIWYLYLGSIVIKWLNVQTLVKLPRLKSHLHHLWTEQPWRTSSVKQMLLHL